MHYNLPKGCAARLCRACGEQPVCVAVRYLALRICGYMARNARPCGRKNPLPFSFSKRSPISGPRQTLQGKGVIHKRVETAGVYPLVRPRGVSAVAAAQPPQFSQPKIGCHSCSAGHRCKNLSQKLAIHFIHRTFHRVSGDNLVHKVDNFLYTPSQAAVYLGFSTTHCNIGCGKTTAA